MLDVRPTIYIAPLDEQEIGPLTPIIHVQNFADEDAIVTGLFRIYRLSLRTLLYSSVLHPTAINHGESADIAAETPFNPSSPAADDYFILCEVTAESIQTHNTNTVPLGQFYFDITPAPMGTPPATHHTTHEDGGMDEVSVTGLSGLLADPQTPAFHTTDTSNLTTADLDTSKRLAPDGLGSVIWKPDHVGSATPGQMLKADANGLATDATNTDLQVAAAVTASHARQHAITSTADHTSAATPDKMLKADDNGLAIAATNTDLEVAAVVSGAERTCSACI